MDGKHDSSDEDMFMSRGNSESTRLESESESSQPAPQSQELVDSSFSQNIKRVESKSESSQQPSQSQDTADPSYSPNISRGESESGSSQQASQSQELSNPLFRRNVSLGGSESAEASESSESLSQEEESTSKYDKMVSETKYIVFESTLDQLFLRCQKCGAPNSITTKHTDGAAVTITAECVNHCVTSWSSSPKIGIGKKSMFVINLLLSCVILTVGAPFATISKFFNELRIPSVSQSSYNKHLNNFVYPVVWFIWLKHQEALLMSLPNLGEEIEMAGDGRYDSPGFTAMICVYFMMCLNIKKVVALSVIHKSQTDNKSTLMEQLGLQTCLHHVASSGVDICRLATDRCAQIKIFMEERFPWIDQEFDTWHWIKNVIKDLIRYSKTKAGKPLEPWLKSINNMLWYSFANCEGNPDLLQEFIMSIVGHCCNKHTFGKFTLLKKCRHGELDEHNTPWLVSGTYPALKLIEALKGKDGSRFLALRKMAHGMNTYLLESLNNKALVWTPKRLYYPPLAMLIRSSLTALDFNENSERGQATTEGGTPRYKLEANRAGSKYTLKEIKKENTHNTMDIIRALVLNCKDLGRVPQVIYPLPNYPKNTAKVQKPSMEEAVGARYSRFRH